MRRVGFTLVAATAFLLASCGQATESSAPDAAPPPPVTEPSQAAPTPAPADNTVFCAEVSRRVTPAQCATYEQLAQNAQRGMAAFNAPSQLQRGEARTLQLAISAPPPPPPPEPAPVTNEETDRASIAPEGNAGAPQTPADVVNQLPGETVEFKPLVGRFMRAELTGAGFEITAQSPAQQEVTNDSVTTWTWQVIARQGGDRALTMTTVVVGCTEGGGECVPLRSTTQNYTVRVAVAPLDQAKDFLLGLPDWIKILSGIIAALAGLFTAVAAFRAATRKNA